MKHVKQTIRYAVRKAEVRLAITIGDGQIGSSIIFRGDDELASGGSMLAAGQLLLSCVLHIERKRQLRLSLLGGERPAACEWKHQTNCITRAIHRNLRCGAGC